MSLQCFEEAPNFITCFYSPHQLVISSLPSLSFPSTSGHLRPLLISTPLFLSSPFPLLLAHTLSLETSVHFTANGDLYCLGKWMWLTACCSFFCLIRTHCTQRWSRLKPVGKHTSTEMDLRGMLEGFLCSTMCWWDSYVYFRCNAMSK